MMTQNRFKPKAYARLAVKRLGVLISEIKQDLDEKDLQQLRDWYMIAYNQNSSTELHKMVKMLNEKRYQTRVSFQVLSCYHKDYGHNTLEIREDRF